jgi:hypothetical protein
MKKFARGQRFGQEKHDVAYLALPAVEVEKWRYIN